MIYASVQRAKYAGSIFLCNFITARKRKVYATRDLTSLDKASEFHYKMNS
jgi:hypothetical protein